MSLNSGDRLGDYEVLGVLGAGGMGEVYKVRNTITNRVEAAKVVLPDMAENLELTERFQREIRLHASLEHPNIADVRTAFRDGNRLIMVMELLDGQTLAERSRQGKMPVAECLNYVGEVLSALEYAHERGVVHRDIKPANIMLTPGGVKIMDFGVAKKESDHSLTKTGFTVGSLYYMSPEQIQAGEVDARSDLYSLGIVLYEMVTGKRPFEGDSDYSVMAAHMEAAPPPPGELNAEIPSPLSDIILMSLAKDPGKRFQTAKAFRNALRSVSPAAPAPASPATATPQPPPPRVGGAPVPEGRPKSGMRLGYMLIGALAAVIVLAVGITQIPKWRSASAEPEASEAVEAPVPAPDVTPDVEPGQQTLTQPETKEAGQPPREPETAAGMEPETAAGMEPETAAGMEPETAAGMEPETAAGMEPETAPAVRQTKPAAPVPAAKATAPAAAPPTPQRQAPAEERSEMPPVERTTGFLEAEAAARAQREAEAALNAALDELNERQILMAVRMSAVNSGLDKLEREQASMGVSLRGDMVAARKLLETRMAQAGAAIESGDAEGAKKYLDQAERPLRTLERFLNL